MRFIFLSLLTLLTAGTFASPILKQADASHYDVVIIGGGPAGLSALSACARVRRKALLIDSGEYRNLLTRHAHDVIGSDGKNLLLTKLAFYADKKIARCHACLFPLESSPADFGISNGVHEERHRHQYPGSELFGLQHF